MKLASLCLIACAACASPGPPPAPGPNDVLAVEEREELSGIERRLAESGQTTGTQAATLMERRGDLLAKAGRAADAVKAWDDAATAYTQTPEATMMPVIRSQRAKEKADALRAKAPPAR